LGKDVLHVYELSFGKRYRRREDQQLPDLGLSLTLWRGVFEGKEDTWLRWCDAEGQVIPTGEERAASAEKRAADAEAEVERLRAELARLKRKPAKKRGK
jgi:hypothetical protein